ncbi:MAG: hypothetical protein ABEJ98_00160 [Candidatus Nanohaloarchaea archaeon]
MLKTVLEDIGIGLAFAGSGYGVVSALGFSSTSFMVLAYLYVALALIIGSRHVVSARFGGFRKALENFVVVAEKEELVMHRVINGEKLKIKGEVEKVQ